MADLHPNGPVQTLRPVSAAVTFEFDTSPPLTWQGVVRATETRTVAARALDAATLAHPGLRWRSVVVVLERLDPPLD
jgi:hypothetical protein